MLPPQPPTPVITYRAAAAPLHTQETNAGISPARTLKSVKAKGKVLKIQVHSFQSTPSQLEAIFKNFLAQFLV